MKTDDKVCLLILVVGTLLIPPIIYTLSRPSRSSPHKEVTIDPAITKASEVRATEMTPDEMDAFREQQLQNSMAHKEHIESKQQAAQSRFTEKENDIYRYMKARWNTFASSPSGYDPDVHDDLVVSEASAKFGVSKSEAKSIYIKVDGAGLDF